MVLKLIMIIYHDGLYGMILIEKTCVSALESSLAPRSCCLLSRPTFHSLDTLKNHEKGGFQMPSTWCFLQIWGSNQFHMFSKCHRKPEYRFHWKKSLISDCPTEKKKLVKQWTRPWLQMFHPPTVDPARTDDIPVTEVNKQRLIYLQLYLEVKAY